MLDKEEIAECVNNAISSPDVFLVEVNVSPSNNVEVVLDSDYGMDVDTCVEISRAIEARFDRDTEDYELEVGSAGLTAPLKVHRQYLKNIGNELEVLTADGRKLRGTLTAVTDGDITLSYPKKQKEPGQKRPVTVTVNEQLPFTQLKKAVMVINF